MSVSFEFVFYFYFENKKYVVLDDSFFGKDKDKKISIN